MNKYKLSIITITYNNPDLKRTLDSVMSQSIGPSDIEHIIVDNRSHDDNEAMINNHITEIAVDNYIKEAPYQVTYIKYVREKGKGIYNAMNKGIRVAHGEYLSFMNAGDYFFDADSVRNIIYNANNYDIVYGNLNVINKENISIYSPPDLIDFNYFLNGSALPHQASIIKRNLFDKIGFYDESLKIISDWKFFLLAICKYKCSYLHLNKTIATYYFDGISSKKENMEFIDKDKNEIFSENFSQIGSKQINGIKSKEPVPIFKTPILFLIFNRPDVTQRVFNEIKKVRPARFYIASDGARKDKKGEMENVKKTRDYILNNIDWNCEVKILFRDENLGCGRAVSSAITWFFEQEKEGIILEDDCLPNQSFFSFCEELLNYYRNDKRVMHISGDQFMSNFDNGASYYFAKNMHCWGWASWADRWENYKYNLVNYNEKNVEKISDNKLVQSYWLKILQRLKNGEFNTWDYQWVFIIIENDGLCINPSKNLISNIGFGNNSTNSFNKDNPNINLPTFEIKKIIHPKKVQIDDKAVDSIFRVHYGINFEKVVKESLKSVIFRFLRIMKKVYEK